MSSRNVRQNTPMSWSQAKQGFRDAIASVNDLDHSRDIRRDLEQLREEADDKVANLGGERLGQREELRRRGEERIRRGQCPDCSLQTHEITPPALITNEQVMGGRFLLCNPTEPVPVAIVVPAATEAVSSSSRARVLLSLCACLVAVGVGSYLNDAFRPNTETIQASRVEATRANNSEGGRYVPLREESPFGLLEEAEQTSIVRFFDDGVWGEYIGDLNAEGGRHGKGKITYEDGGFFNGEWKNNKRDGQGSRRDEKGWTFDGGWKNDKAEGQGVVRFPNGKNNYEGEFKNGQKEGRGTEWWSSGDKYEGGFRGGNKEGEGVFTWANGGSYMGGYKDDNMEGRGILRYADGRSEIQVYRNGKLSGKGVRWSKNRKNSWLLEEGEVIRKIELWEAKVMAALMGFADVS